MVIYVVTRVSGLLFIGFVVVELLRFILSAPQVDAEVLCAAVAGFLLSGLAWSLAYNLLDRLDPNSFVFTLSSKNGFSMNGFTSLYFSFITLSTLGYGDIVPVAQVARMLAMAEAMFGMFYMALLVARLVSLYSAEPNREWTRIKTNTYRPTADRLDNREKAQNKIEEKTHAKAQRRKGKTEEAQSRKVSGVKSTQIYADEGRLRGALPCLQGRRSRNGE